MPIITLQTTINNTLENCFDLSRSVELHKISTSKTLEEAIAGKISGLLELNDWVTWQAIHFGINQKLTVKITTFDKPNSFTDQQIKGIFKSFSHFHSFKQMQGHIIMTDVFEYQVPFGIFGKIFDYFILNNYMKNFLESRNKIIKEYAETNLWKKIVL
jgi:ligand-binding SRPBCC domain-containing protein